MLYKIFPRLAYFSATVGRNFEHTKRQWLFNGDKATVFSENKIRTPREYESVPVLDVATVVRTITPMKTRAIKSRLSASWLSSFLSPPSLSLSLYLSFVCIIPHQWRIRYTLGVICPPIIRRLSKLPVGQPFALKTVDFSLGRMLT